MGCATVERGGGGLSLHSVALPCRGCIPGTTRGVEGGLQRADHDTKPTRNSRNVFPVVSGFRACTHAAHITGLYAQQPPQ